MSFSSPASSDTALLTRPGHRRFARDEKMDFIRPEAARWKPRLRCAAPAGCALFLGLGGCEAEPASQVKPEPVPEVKPVYQIGVDIRIPEAISSDPQALDEETVRLLLGQELLLSYGKTGSPYASVRTCAVQRLVATYKGREPLVIEPARGPAGGHPAKGFPFEEPCPSDYRIGFEMSGGISTGYLIRYEISDQERRVTGQRSRSAADLRAAGRQLPYPSGADGRFHHLAVRDVRFIGNEVCVFMGPTICTPRTEIELGEFQ